MEGGGFMTPSRQAAIVIDTREQTPLAFPSAIPTVRGTLRTGDYSVTGYEDAFAVERKSLSDLVHTVIHDRARFERELERMRPFSFRRVLVTSPYEAVARGEYEHSRANPRSVVASIAAFEARYNVPFVFAANPGEAATRLVDWARYFVREKRLERKKAPPLPNLQNALHYE